jgi:hypothetical protein
MNPAKNRFPGRRFNLCRQYSPRGAPFSSYLPLAPLACLRGSLRRFRAYLYNRRGQVHAQLLPQGEILAFMAHRRAMPVAPLADPHGVLLMCRGGSAGLLVAARM